MTQIKVSAVVHWGSARTGRQTTVGLQYITYSLSTTFQ